MMKHIRISNNAHMKIVNRKTYELTSVEKVVDDIMMKIDDVKTAPVATSNGPCKQCAEYKQKWEEVSDTALEAIGAKKDIEVKYNAAQKEINELRIQLGEPIQPIVESEQSEE